MPPYENPSAGGNGRIMRLPISNKTTDDMGGRAQQPYPKEVGILSALKAIPPETLI